MIKRRAALALLIFIVLAGALIGFTSRIAAQTDYYYLARWEWFTEKESGTQYWRCPGGDCVGTLDLRSTPQMSQAGGTPEGYGIFAYDHPITCIGCYALGTDMERPLTALEKGTLTTALSLAVPIAQDRLADIIAVDLFTANADPTGTTKWKPIRGSLRNNPAIYLAGAQIWEGTLEDVLDSTIAVYRADYAGLKSDGVPLEQLRKVTGAKMVSLWGRMGDDLLTPLLGTNAGDGWTRPATVITESFDTSDSDTLGPDLSWTEYGGDLDVVSNKAQGVTATTWIGARADSALSTDAMYSQADCQPLASASTRVGPATRWNAAAQTHYLGSYRNYVSGTYVIWKVVTGTPTSLANVDLGSYPGFTERVVKLNSDAADLHELFIDAASKTSVTDSAITSNVYAGIAGYGGIANDATWNDFEAGDLAAAAARRIITIQ